MKNKELIGKLSSDLDRLKIFQEYHGAPKTEKTKPIIKPSDLAKYIEHTILKPEATSDQVQRICEEAKQYNFRGVCVNPVYIKNVQSLLAGTDILIVAVIGFPLGANMSVTKAKEAEQVIKVGVDEIDMVMQIGKLKEKDYLGVYKDIVAVRKVAALIRLKVIIECCLLTEEEKIAACLIAMRAGASFVKTSTGFSKSGATPEDVALMKEVVGDKLGVKAAGGIRDFQTAKRMIEAGANRIGCSASVEIVKG